MQVTVVTCTFFVHEASGFPMGMNYLTSYLMRVKYIK
jgi:hypothetical protein